MCTSVMDNVPGSMDIWRWNLIVCWRFVSLSATLVISCRQVVFGGGSWSTQKDLSTINGKIAKSKMSATSEVQTHTHRVGKPVFIEMNYFDQSTEDAPSSTFRTLNILSILLNQHRPVFKYYYNERKTNL